MATAKPAAKAAAKPAAKKAKARKKEKKNISFGHAHIKSTFNNTIVSITDPTGAVLAWASSGGVGFPQVSLLKQQPRRRRSMASARSMYSSRDQVLVARLLSVPYKQPDSRSVPSLM